MSEKVLDISKSCTVCGLPRNKRIKRIHWTDYDDDKSHYAYFCSEECRKEFEAHLD